MSHLQIMMLFTTLLSNADAYKCFVYDFVVPGHAETKTKAFQRYFDNLAVAPFLCHTSHCLLTFIV